MSALTKLRERTARAESRYQTLQSESYPDKAALDKARERFHELERELAAEEQRLLAGGKLRF